jgi:hypothetical protein
VLSTGGTGRKPLPCFAEPAFTHDLAPPAADLIIAAEITKSARRNTPRFQEWVLSFVLSGQWDRNTSWASIGKEH